jgi:putative transposase
MSSATFYKWRTKFGGMDASMMTRLKELEEENRRLKKMYAEERLKAEILKAVSVKLVVRYSKLLVSNSLALQSSLLAG